MLVTMFTPTIGRPAGGVGGAKPAIASSSARSDAGPGHSPSTRWMRSVARPILADRLILLGRHDLVRVPGDPHARRGQLDHGIGRHHTRRAVGVAGDGGTVEDPLGLRAEHGGNAAELLPVATDD